MFTFLWILNPSLVKGIGTKTQMDVVGKKRAVYVATGVGGIETKRTGL